MLLFTSDVKSMWPGVSMMLKRCLKEVSAPMYEGFQKHVIAAAVMVMPRSLSCSIQSVTVFPLVHFADFVALAGVVEDALRRGSFPRVDVGDDAEIAHFLQWIIPTHRLEYYFNYLLAAHGATS
jgi:hypothetical protein